MYIDEWFCYFYINDIIKNHCKWSCVSSQWCCRLQVHVWLMTLSSSTLLNTCGTVLQVFVLSLLICCLQLHLDFWSVSGQVLVRNRWWVFHGRELEAIVYILMTCKSKSQRRHPQCQNINCQLPLQDKHEQWGSFTLWWVHFLHRAHDQWWINICYNNHVLWSSSIMSVMSVKHLNKRDLIFCHSTVSIETVYCIIWFMCKLIFCFILNI